MKRFICVLLLICLVFVACDNGNDDNPVNNNGNNGNNNNTETITIDKLSIKDTSIKSLYISNIPVNSSARAASGSTIQTLCYINESGESSPFLFTTPSGKNVMLDVKDLNQVDNKRITITFDSYYIITDSISNVTNANSKTALVDFEKNKVYDFSGWNIYSVYNDIAFVGSISNNMSDDDWGTIYKIDLNNISVVMPLNNGKYFPVGGARIFGNKIVSGSRKDYGDYYVIDINNDLPITPLKNGFITNDSCSFIPVNNPYEVKIFGVVSGLTFIDYSGDTWFFVAGGGTPGISRYGGYQATDFGVSNKYCLGKIDVDDDGQMFLDDYEEYSFSFTPNYNRNSFVFFLYPNGNSIDRTKVGVDDTSIENNLIIMCNDGFIALKRSANGIQVETTPLSASLPILNHDGKSFIKDNYLYFLDDTTIKRIHLSAESSTEILYSNNRILTNEGITIVGDTIFFYQFANDNISVNAYSMNLSQQNPIPILLSTDTIEIKNIIELDF